MANRSQALGVGGNPDLMHSFIGENLLHKSVTALLQAVRGTHLYRRVCANWEEPFPLADEMSRYRSEVGLPKPSSSPSMCTRQMSRPWDHVAGERHVLT